MFHKNLFLENREDGLILIISISMLLIEQNSKDFVLYVFKHVNISSDVYMNKKITYIPKKRKGIFKRHKINI